MAGYLAALPTQLEAAERARDEARARATKWERLHDGRTKSLTKAAAELARMRGENSALDARLRAMRQFDADAVAIEENVRAWKNTGGKPTPPESEG